MINVYLYRIGTSDQGTKGIWLAPNFYARILELPWRDNKPNVSCIPEGSYLCKIRRSRKFGVCYHLTDVKKRTWILTHSGNLAGDLSKGFKTHTFGCLLMGKYFGTIANQPAVLLSRVTLKRFLKLMNGEAFTLHVKELYRRRKVFAA